MRNLTAEQIVDNYNKLFELIKQHISEPRASQLTKLYTEYGDDLALIPGSSNINYHNCFEGGYVEHVLRVVDCSLKLYDVWASCGANVTSFTKEELVFSAINHDLGKIGFPGQPYYKPNSNDWSKKQGNIYEINTDIDFMKVPDRSLYILQSAGIKISTNEFLAIKLHDGLYGKGNESYYMHSKPDFALRTNLVLLIHHADHMAASIEHDLNHSSQQPKQTTTNKKQGLGQVMSDKDLDVNDMFKQFKGII